MIKPIPNLNGSDVNDLLTPRLQAYTALQEVRGHLAKACPHGRDYPLAFERADEDRKAHFARLQQIDKLAKEILDEAVSIRLDFDQYKQRTSA